MLERISALQESLHINLHAGANQLVCQLYSLGAQLIEFGNRTPWKSEGISIPCLNKAQTLFRRRRQPRSGWQDVRSMENRLHPQDRHTRATQ